MTKQTAPATAQEEQIQYADPAAFHVGENTRYNLKQSRIDSLAAAILEDGRILQPIEVRELEDGTPDITSGFYRHAAALKLNGSGAGILVPYIVRNVDDKTRLMHQLSENMERENQSPMDMAIAIKALMDAGVERKEIRRIFARPGGQKGTEVQPASNAWLNIIVGLLDLPKPIQQKIHSGLVGISGAYELGKVPPEKRQAVLARIEDARTKAVEQEAKDEEAYLKAESKVTEVEEKLQTVTTEEGELRTAIDASLALVKSSTKEFRDLQKIDYLNLEDAAKQEHRKKLTEAEGIVKAAQKSEKDAKNKLAKLLEGKRKLVDATTEARERLEAAKKAKGFPKKKNQTVGADEVKTAAAAEGVGTGFVALTASEMRGAIKEIAKEPGNPRVAAIGMVLERIFSGELTTKAGIKEITAYVTAPQKAPAAKPAPKAKAAPATE